MFVSEDWPFDSEERQRNAYLKNFMAPDKLVLKVGAQVMLIKNLTEELVNGTIGTVVGFGTVTEFQHGFEDEDDMTGASDAVLARQKTEKKLPGGKKVPFVRWRVGSSLLERPMEREDFVVEDTKGQKVASRKQVSGIEQNLANNRVSSCLLIGIYHSAVSLDSVSISRVVGPQSDDHFDVCMTVPGP